MLSASVNTISSSSNVSTCIKAKNFSGWVDEDLRHLLRETPEVISYYYLLVKWRSRHAGKRPDGGFYLTYKKIAETYNLSPYKIRKMNRILQSHGLISVTREGFRDPRSKELSYRNFYVLLPKKSFYDQPFGVAESEKISPTDGEKISPILILLTEEKTQEKKIGGSSVFDLAILAGEGICFQGKSSQESGGGWKKPEYVVQPESTVMPVDKSVDSVESLFAGSSVKVDATKASPIKMGSVLPFKGPSPAFPLAMLFRKQAMLHHDQVLMPEYGGKLKGQFTRLKKIFGADADDFIRAVTKHWSSYTSKVSVQYSGVVATKVPSSGYLFQHLDAFKLAWDQQKELALKFKSTPTPVVEEPVAKPAPSLPEPSNGVNGYLTQAQVTYALSTLSGVEKLAFFNKLSGPEKFYAKPLLTKDELCEALKLSLAEINQG